jgi:pimeloyl-ACP methyl ester carboxylesterase
MTRSRLTTRLRIASLIAPLLFAISAHAATVSGIQTAFHDGQTFLTWDNLPGTGWIYHVYSSSSPLSTQNSLDNAMEIAQVGENSGVDSRMSSLLGQTYTFRIDESQPPLAASRGLFVITPVVGALNFYAVIAERVGLGVDRTLVLGQNSITEPVWERVQRPRPIWQRTLTSPAGEDYVLWTTNAGSQLFPAMCNTPGRAFHVGVIRGQQGGALVLNGHGRGGNFFNSLSSTGMPGEWVLSIDDYLPTGDYSSFYFGYEVNYDLDQPFNFPRTDGGIVGDFTEQRVMFLLDWANREMPHDPNRVYAMGASMGGSFAFFLAWHHPDLIAGALSVVPKICLGYRPDAYPDLRESLDRMWGSPDIDLPTTEGERVFQWMDGREQARIARHRGSAPLVGFCGLNDHITGWSEKVAYFQAMHANKSGGAWFWDERDHYTPQDQTAWFPMMAARQVYKYRTDTSYPAFTNCSSDGNFGSGDPATADPIGNINGGVDWDENAVAETWLRWDVTLRTRGLTTQDGVIGAPESLLVDVTPRRLQKFIVAEQVVYQYEVRRLSDGVIVQSGEATPDGDAVLTIPQVKVFNSGVRLTVFPGSTTGVSPQVAASHRPYVALSRNPVQGKASLTIEWPGAGDGVVELFDMQGRRLRTEFRGLAQGVTERTFRTEGLAPGLYLLSARQGSAVTVHRVTVLH